MSDSVGQTVQALCEFMSSPLWTVPVQSFIDERCIGFLNEEESRMDNAAVFSEYSGIIDQLVALFISTTGTAPTQLLDACQVGSMTSGPAFEQLLAADDFLVFSKMMSHRNTQLDLEAYALFQTGGSVDGVKPAAEEPLPADDEEALVEQAMRLSLEDSGAAERLLAEEQAALEHAIALSLALEGERKQQPDAAAAPAAPAAGSAFAADTVLSHERQQLAGKALAQLQQHQGLELETGVAPAAEPGKPRPQSAARRRPLSAAREKPVTPERLAEQQRDLERIRKALAEKRRAEREKALKDYQLATPRAAAPAAPDAARQKLGQRLAALVRREAAVAGAPAPMPHTESLRQRVEAERLTAN